MRYPKSITDMHARANALDGLFAVRGLPKLGMPPRATCIPISETEDRGQRTATASGRARGTLR